MEIRRSARKWGAWAHVWFGVISGLLFSVLGLTGSIIVFRPQIEAALTPRPAVATCAAVLGPEHAVAATTAFMTAASVDRIVFPPDESSVYTLQLRSATGAGSRLAYDGCAGRILGTISTRWLDWIVDFHHNFLAGRVGRRFVGAAGIGLALTAFSGSLIWLLSGARWRSLFQIARNASLRRAAFDLHRCTGMLALLVLSVQSLTGIWLAYPQSLRSPLARLVRGGETTRVKRTEKKARSEAGAVFSLTHAVELAKRAIPDGRIKEMRLPGPEGRQMFVRVWRPGDLMAEGNNTVVLNAQGTRAISIERFADQPILGRVPLVITFIHYGEWGGLAARVLLSLFGLAPVVLFVSGLLIRWGPRRAVKGSRQTRQPEVALVP